MKGDSYLSLDLANVDLKDVFGKFYLDNDYEFRPKCYTSEYFPSFGSRCKLNKKVLNRNLGQTLFASS